MIKFIVNTFILILILLSNNIYSDEKKISKIFLKYSREKAIAYASKFWLKINDREYYNFGSAIINPFTDQVDDSRDCSFYNKEITVYPNSYTCGGDCANFIS